MDSLNFNSVETLPNLSARAAFQVNSSAVFKEDVDIVPVIIDDKLSYVPWGGDNQMPFNILKLIEDDETLSTCQMFNAEVCFGSGLQYSPKAKFSGYGLEVSEPTAQTLQEIDDFFLDNDIASYFLGVCQDFKHFGFAVSVIILSRDGSKIVRLLRKEACYCRFAPADKSGKITKLLYANWRKCIASREDIEVIELLDPTSPWRDLQDKFALGSKTRKFAIVSRIPTVDSTYYPIPYYKTVFLAMRHAIDDMDARNECMETMRELFRQLMSRLTLERVRIEQNGIYIDPRITFNEIDRYFFSGCACAYFTIAVDCFTDLRLREEEWETGDLKPEK